MIEILDYKQEHQTVFEKLNREWIEEFFWMEPIDFDVLQHPEEHILKKGGFILVATHEKEAVGAVALKFVGLRAFELTKMAVDKNYRGKKIGLALATAALKKAKVNHAERVILYSHTSLIPAITLYRKLGFREIQIDGIYKRGDIKMELIISRPNIV